MQTIKKTVAINAPRMTVWNVITEDAKNRQWYSEFSKGTYAVTDWKEGSKAIFRDDSDFGLISLVQVSKPGEELSVEFTGVLEGGKEVYEGAQAESMKGGHERYFLTEQNGTTTLNIEADMPEKYVEDMSNRWDKALVVLKDLAENN